MEVVRQRSKAWYLLPILLHTVGGLLAYFILRNSDKRLAKRCLKFGLLNLALQFFGSILIQMFITGPILTN